jgi:hypothetical protein
MKDNQNKFLHIFSELIKLLPQLNGCQLAENAYLALLLAYSHGQLPAERRKGLILQSTV